MIKLYPSPVRAGLKEVLNQVNTDLLIATPFIRASEVTWLCDELATCATYDSVRTTVLTDVRAENVLSGSLEIRALSLFSKRLPKVDLINLPRIHAKVYIADKRFALVTSSNLTASGLDINFEYGVGLDDPVIVGRIYDDMQNYARMGNLLSEQIISNLADVADDLSTEFQKLRSSTQAKFKIAFQQALRHANREFLSAQVGFRSANNLFSEAILYILSSGPMPTRELHPKIQSLLPELCDDATELVINGETFGKKWKHAVRNAQQSLKRDRKITFDGRYWKILTHTRTSK